MPGSGSFLNLQLGFVTASLFISKLQARPQQNMLTRVLREYGKLEKTIFILRYIQDPVFRRDINLAVFEQTPEKVKQDKIFENVQ